MELITWMVFSIGLMAALAEFAVIFIYAKKRIVLSAIIRDNMTEWFLNIFFTELILPKLAI